jgi:hypothetical protein
MPRIRNGGKQWVVRVLNNLDDYVVRLRGIVLNETYIPSKCTYEIKMEYGKEDNFRWHIYLRNWQMTGTH